MVEFLVLYWVVGNCFCYCFPLCGCDSAEVIVSAKTIYAKNEKTTANGMSMKTKLCGPAGNVLSRFFNSNESKHPGASIPWYVYLKDEWNHHSRMYDIENKNKDAQNKNAIMYWKDSQSWCLNNTMFQPPCLLTCKMISWSSTRCRLSDVCTSDIVY